MVIVFELVIITPAPDYWQNQEAFQTVLSNTPRVFGASLLAFVVGDFVNDKVFAKMKAKHPDSIKGFGWRAILSSLLGELVDSIVFLPIAFLGLMPVKTLIQMTIAQVFIKTGYEVVILPVTTLVAKKLSKIEKGEATHTLFNQMAVFINTHDTPPKYLGNRSYNLEQQIEEMCVSTKHFDFVSGILWCMGELGLVDELIAFEEWDKMVRRKFLGSEELQYMGNAYSSVEEKELWHLFLQTLIECLPTEYQQLVQTKYPSTSKPTKEELLNNNPALNSLVEKLGLEIVR
jgi:hypothetical protein